MINTGIFKFVVLCITVLAMGCMPLQARDFFVSPRGADGNPGTKARPFASFKHAVGRLRPGDTLFLREGIYRESLKPVTSGTELNPIIISNYTNEKVVISGADLLMDWKRDEKGVYSARMPWSLKGGNQIFINGAMTSEARWPNAGDTLLFNPNRAIVESGTPNSLSCSELAGDDGTWNGAELWCAGGAQWICWTVKVTGFESATRTLTFDTKKKKWYAPRKGNAFILRGLRRCLDAPGEWFYEESPQRLLLIPPQGVQLDDLVVEAKRRRDAIDLSGLSHIHVKGIQFRAAGLRTDKLSSNVTLINLKGAYVSHHFAKDLSNSSGVLIYGRNILVLNCDFGYSSGSVLNVAGVDNRIINCYIHHGGYAGLWRGTVRLSGRRIVFSHNTVKHAGRDLINTHGLMESLVQYNDVSEAGWLTSDLGMFYGHNTDFANTVFRHNLVHDNHAKHFGMGIYFDHLSNNMIVHHNVIWNVKNDPVRINNPSYCALVFNNSAWRTQDVVTFDHAKRNDLFASRYYNNIFNGAFKLPRHVVVTNNMLNRDPPYVNPGAVDFRFKGDNKGNVGAYPTGAELFRAGCDFDNRPDPLPVYEAPRIKGMNMVRNSCFEFATLESWEKIDANKAELVEGNGWGNHVFGNIKNHATGTMKQELRLGPGRDGVKQIIKGLSPGTMYSLSAWLRVSDAKESIEVEVEGQPEARVVTSSTEWVRKSVEFTTESESTEVTIILRKMSSGGGNAWVDNLTLPL